MGLKYGTDVRTLQQVNCLENSTIIVGQRLYVPGPAALPTLATPTDAVTNDPLPTATPQTELSNQQTAEEPVEVPAIAVPESETAAMAGSGVRVNIPDRYLHIVLLGADMRPAERLGNARGRPNQATWRTDAIIIVSVDTEDHTVRLLHIPRDMYVEIPGHGYNRINTAEMWGEFREAGTGPDLVKQTIYQNLGIPVHYYIRMDFAGFVHFIDALGGVDIDVPCPVPKPKLEPGIHHFDGVQALRYVESREGTTDYERGERQWEMLMALKDQYLTPEIIPKLPQLWVTMADYYDTDLPLNQVIDLAYVALHLRGSRIEKEGLSRKQLQHYVTPEGAWVLKPREEELPAMLEEFYSPADTEPMEEVDRVKVQVLNGSERYQAEELAAAALKRKGLKVIDKGQADRQDYKKTQIRIFKGDPAAGEWIAERLHLPSSAILDLTGVPDPPDRSNPVDVKVVLGKDYDPCMR
jgi:LCP family protein required for cell wall assembly